jgi:hypothetical protein
MYSDRNDWLEPVGFPHSEISGSLAVCASPKLIAAYHVLHRLHAPRHPPCALSSLTIKFAHHKPGQHIDSLTPSSSRNPKISEENLQIGNLPIRLSKSITLSVAISREPDGNRQNLGPAAAETAPGASFKALVLVEVRGFEPLTPWLQTMCSAS